MELETFARNVLASAEGEQDIFEEPALKELLADELCWCCRKKKAVYLCDRVTGRCFICSSGNKKAGGVEPVICGNKFCEDCGTDLGNGKHLCKKCSADISREELERMRK